MYCGQCGYNNPDDASFCKSCGKPLAKSDTQEKRPTRTLKTTGVIAALVVVLIASFFVVKRVWFTDGQPSADRVAQELTKSTNGVVSSGFSESSINSLLSTLVGLMPKEAVSAMLAEEGLSDYSQLSEELGVMGGLSGLESYMDSLDINCEYYVGDQLPQDELDSINESFKDHGIELRATEGNTLGLSMNITALKDFQGIGQGETKSQSTESTGLVAIAIGNRWYLWSNDL